MYPEKCRKGFHMCPDDKSVCFDIDLELGPSLTSPSRDKFDIRFEMYRILHFVMVESKILNSKGRWNNKISKKCSSFQRNSTNFWFNIFCLFNLGAKQSNEIATMKSNRVRVNESGQPSVLSRRSSDNSYQINIHSVGYHSGIYRVSIT